MAKEEEFKGEMPSMPEIPEISKQHKIERKFLTSKNKSN